MSWDNSENPLRVVNMGMRLIREEQYIWLYL